MSASSAFFNNTSQKVTGRFKHWLKHHPIITNSILCANLWIAGDFLAQYSELNYLTHDDSEELALSDKTANATKKEQDSSSSSSSQSALAHPDGPSFWKEVDLFRTAKCAGYGAALTGPLLATWYPFLERICVSNNIVARYGLWGPPILKVVADEFLMDPPLLLVFFGYMNVCEGGTMETFKSKIDTQFMPSWLTSLAVWPFVLLATFRFAPIYAHAPIINACCIAWDGFLSHRNTLSKSQKSAGVEPMEDPAGNSPEQTSPAADKKLRITA